MVGTHLRQDLFEQVKRLAHEEGRTVSNVVERLIEKGLERIEQKEKAA